MASSRYTVVVTGPDGEVTYNFPSVTEIIERCVAKPGLHDWYYKEGVKGFSYLAQKYGDKVPSDVKSIHSLMKTEGQSPYAKRDSAAKEGRKIHDAVLALTKGQRPADIPNLTDYWKARGWRRADILAAEQVVVSFLDRYAGTLDLVYSEDGLVTLSDIKSGEVRDSHKLQVELYRRAWLEQGGVDIDRLSIIQVPRDGSPCSETFIPISHELEFAAIGVLNLYAWLKGEK